MVRNRILITSKNAFKYIALRKNQKVVFKTIKLSRQQSTKHLPLQLPQKLPS